jgi:cytochrome c-type biogenesis protein CcmH
MNVRIDALRQKLQQLQALHDSGALGASAYAEARAPLERELVEAVMQGAATAPVVRPSRRLGFGLALGIVVLAVAGYSVTGSPLLAGRGIGGAPAAAVVADNGGPPVTDEQINEIVARVAKRLEEQPDDAAGWTLLARAYSAMGRQSEAIPAFRKALALTGEDATLLADYADALAAQDNGRFSPETLKIIDRALALEPDNFKALALSGSAAFDQGDYTMAVRQWEQVERSLPPDSRMLPQVRASIAQARELGGLPAAAAGMAASPAPATAANPAPAGSTVAAAKVLRGRVSLAPALAASASPQDTVFVLARPAEGARMPLAVLRKQVKDLPLDFTLDDSMAMAPTAKVSDHARIVVLARVSKSGEAMPRPGDLSGQSAVVAPGASGIEVQISDVVPTK